MKRNNLYIGIDPGVTGCSVAITNETARFFDTPGNNHKRMVEIVDKIVDKYLNTHNIFAYIEDVHSIAKWGCVNSDKLIANKNLWIGIIAANHIPVAEVKPKTWQNYTVQKVSGEDTKWCSKNSSKKSYYWGYEEWSVVPRTIEKIVGSNHNRSDAFLIATFCERTKGTLCQK